MLTLLRTLGICFLLFATAAPQNVPAATISHAGKTSIADASCSLLPPGQTTEFRVQAAKPGINPDDAYTSTIEGVLSLVCAGFVAVSLIALSATSFSFFIIPVIAFSILAVLFGAAGLGHHKRGQAIAGMALGLIGLIAGFAALAATP